MNIGYLYGFNAYPPQGGNSIHVYQLVQWFKKRGHTVHTIGDSRTPSVQNYPSNDLGIDTFLSNIDVLYVRIDGWYLNQSPIKKKCMDRATVPIVWEINAPSNEMLAFSNLIPKIDTGVRIVEIATLMKRKLHGIRKMPRIYWDEFTRRMYARRVETAVCVSDAVERYARESLGIQRTVVLPNGSDPDLFSPHRESVPMDPHYENHLKILWAGSPMYPWHSLDLVQTVIQKAKRITEDILFILLVNQPSPLIPKGDNVIVFEKVGYFDVAKYIGSADICLCLHPDYTWSKWGFHGSTIKLFDYMACGKPVIASRVGQIQSVIDDGNDGLLVDNDPDDVVQKMFFLFERRQKMHEMGTLAREKVIRYYNWERVADATLEIFSSLCAKSKMAHQ